MPRGSLLTAALAAAAVLCGSAPLAAQESPARLTAEDARKCAMWASALSNRTADQPEVQQALSFAANYFTGYYEGMTGRGIGDGDDMAMAQDVFTNIERTSQMCGSHMMGYGQRMIEWGEDLIRQANEVSEQPSGN